jgi:hypothetical protein
MLVIEETRQESGLLQDFEHNSWPWARNVGCRKFGVLILSPVAFCLVEKAGCHLRNENQLVVDNEREILLLNSSDNVL